MCSLKFYKKVKIFNYQLCKLSWMRYRTIRLIIAYSVFLSQISNPFEPDWVYSLVLFFLSYAPLFRELWVQRNARFSNVWFSVDLNRPGFCISENTAFFSYKNLRDLRKLQLGVSTKLRNLLFLTWKFSRCSKFVQNLSAPAQHCFFLKLNFF